MPEKLYVHVFVSGSLKGRLGVMHYAAWLTPDLWTRFQDQHITI